MCGIAGIISKHNKLSAHAKDTVKSMNLKLTHRGPDSAGYYSDSICALAMRRLSIIDIQGGEQPVFNETEDIIAFQNGEIYNYRELRSGLMELGHRFSTESDTEVLVHLYEEYGEQMLTHLHGMFAFCIYDKKNEVFLLARDRFGEKPLYYWNSGEELAFSSEITSLLQHTGINRELNLEALPYYLRTSLVPEPLTLFKDIKTLPSGNLLKIKKSQSTVKPYFTIQYSPNSNITNTKQAVEHIKPHLIKAVQKQMVSDVPIGAFLSGGIDSSTMVALLQQQSSKPIQTFNVKFEDQTYDESAIAKAVAQHCGTDHHEVVIANQEFSEDIFWDIIDHMGHPFRDSSAIPSYFVSQAIGNHVKVAISGDGGDEQFGGYSLFQWYTRIMQIKNINLPARKLMLSSVGALSHVPGLTGSSKLRQVRRALETARLEEKEVAIALNEMFDQREVLALLADKSIIMTDGLRLLMEYPSTYDTWSPLRKIMYYRARHTLSANMLVKVDRMSMANSLEVRAPFLDPVLSDAAAQLPDNMLMKDGLGKIVLREMMKDQLPSEVFSHPKQGFNIPLHKYQNKAYKALAQRLLLEENPLPNLFVKSQLEQILSRGLSTLKDNSKMSAFRASHQLWMIMQLLGWAERFDVTMNEN